MNKDKIGQMFEYMDKRLIALEQRMNENYTKEEQEVLTAWREGRVTVSQNRVEKTEKICPHCRRNYMPCNCLGNIYKPEPEPDSMEDVIARNILIDPKDPFADKKVTDIADALKAWISERIEEVDGYSQEEIGEMGSCKGWFLREEDVMRAVGVVSKTKFGR